MTRKTNEEFHEDLNRGLEFEQGHALRALHKMFPEHYIINNKVDPTQSTDDKVVGPRLYKGTNRETEIIAPDFLLFNDAGNAFWIDAKLKGATYIYNGRRYFSLDRKKHEAYCKFPQFMLDNFFLLFKHEKTKEIYLADFRTEPDTIYFNNRFDTGHVPVYYVDTIQKIYGVHDDK